MEQTLSMSSIRLRHGIILLILSLLTECSTTASSVISPMHPLTALVTGKWRGGSIFYDLQGHKRAFLVTFEVSSDEKRIENFQAGYAYSWPLDGSWDGRNSDMTSTEIGSRAFSTTVIIPVATNDPYKQDYLSVNFAGAFEQSGTLTGTFVSTSTFGSGQWLAAPESAWDWEHMGLK
jgi:hypothetical protein